MPEIASLFIADPPEVWSGLGFTVDDLGASWTSGIRHQLGVDGKGIVGWALRHTLDTVDMGADSSGDALDVDGLVTALDSSPVDASASAAAHPNGVIALDHVVLGTPDVARTIAALEAVGFELRRTRETGTYGAPMFQAFFKAGSVVLELVGPAEAAGDEPSRFFGLAWTVSDLGNTAQFLGDRLHPAKDAVQPGRRIATLDRASGSRVRMAFMSPGND